MAFDPAKVRSSYDRVAPLYADEVDDELSHRPLERVLLGVLPELAGLAATPGVVADLGAGPAHVGRHMRAAGVPTIAIDLAPAMAAIAHHRNRVPAAAGSLTALPLGDASLVAAIVFYAVIHLDDAGLAAAAGELARFSGRAGSTGTVSESTSTSVPAARRAPPAARRRRPGRGRHARTAADPGRRVGDPACVPRRTTAVRAPDGVVVAHPWSRAGGVSGTAA